MKCFFSSTPIPYPPTPNSFKMIASTNNEIVQVPSTQSFAGLLNQADKVKKPRVKKDKKKLLVEEQVEQVKTEEEVEEKEVVEVEEEVVEEEEEVVESAIDIVADSVVADEIISKKVQFEADEDEEEADEETDEIEKQIRELQEKKKKLELKKKMEKRSKEYAEEITLMLNTELEEKRKRIEELQQEVAENETHLEALKSMEETEIMPYLAKHFENEMNELLDAYGDKKKKTTPKAKKQSAKSAVKSKPATNGVVLSPAERWELIEAGTIFKSKSKEYTNYYTKLTDGRVQECDEDGNADGDILNGIQEAGNHFKLFASIPYNISGWEFLQIYDKATGTRKSLKHWKGDVEYLKF